MGAAIKGKPTKKKNEIWVTDTKNILFLGAGKRHKGEFMGRHQSAEVSGA